MTAPAFIHARFASPLGLLHLVLDGEALVALDYPGFGNSDMHDPQSFTPSYKGVPVRM